MGIFFILRFLLEEWLNVVSSEDTQIASEDTQMTSEDTQMNFVDTEMTSEDL